MARLGGDDLSTRRGTRAVLGTCCEMEWTFGAANDVHRSGNRSDVRREHVCYGIPKVEPEEAFDEET